MLRLDNTTVNVHPAARANVRRSVKSVTTVASALQNASRVSMPCTECQRTPALGKPGTLKEAMQRQEPKQQPVRCHGTSAARWYTNGIRRAAGTETTNAL